MEPPGIAPKNPSRAPSQLLMAKAIEKLQDPKVRSQLLGYGRTGMKAAQQWQQERVASAPIPTTESKPGTRSSRPKTVKRQGIGQRVGEQFGHGRLDVA